MSILRDLVPAARRAEGFLQSLVAAAAESSTPPVALLQSFPEPAATSVDAGSVGRAASRSRPQRVSFRPTPRLLSLGNGSQGGGLHRRAASAPSLRGLQDETLSKESIGPGRLLDASEPKKGEGTGTTDKASSGDVPPLAEPDIASVSSTLFKPALE